MEIMEWIFEEFSILRRQKHTNESLIGKAGHDQYAFLDSTKNHTNLQVHYAAKFSTILSPMLHFKELKPQGFLTKPCTQLPSAKVRIYVLVHDEARRALKFKAWAVSVVAKHLSTRKMVIKGVFEVLDIMVLSVPSLMRHEWILMS